MTSKLKKEIRKVIKEFENKQDLIFDHAIQDDLLDMLCFNDAFFFNLQDIVTDLEKESPKHAIIQWHDMNIDRNRRKKPYINYKTYLKTI